MSSLNTTNIGRIERGLVVMGCVLDVVRGVLASIKGGHPERVGGIPRVGLGFYCLRIGFLGGEVGEKVLKLVSTLLSQSFLPNKRTSFQYTHASKV